MRARRYGRLKGLLLVACPLLIAFALLTAYALWHCSSLYCVHQAESADTQCAEASRRQSQRRTPLSDARELILEEVSLKRELSSATVTLRLKGGFWNEQDQNIYVFIGQASAPGSYSLSADEQYFTDLSYPVRNTVTLPHSDDVRIGVMAPKVSVYSPQVYVTDPVHADLVGGAARAEVEAEGNVVRIKFPLDEYYRLARKEAPTRVSVTVATARDYVGFVDQISVPEVGTEGSASSSGHTLPPAEYPMLNYDSHVFKRVSLEDRGGALRVEFEMAAEIQDWAQTNLHFFFIPYPPTGGQRLPPILLRMSCCLTPGRSTAASTHPTDSSVKAQPEPTSLMTPVIPRERPWRIRKAFVFIRSAARHTRWRSNPNRRSGSGAMRRA